MEVDIDRIRAHLNQCCRIAEARRSHGFTLDERDTLSDYLTIAFPLPLPTDDEFAQRLSRTMYTRLSADVDRRLSRTERAILRRREQADRNENLADGAQTGE